MARAPSEAERQMPCAGCHTTVGFLAALGVCAFASAPPSEGVGCAACHAPHDASSGPHLLRAVTLPPEYADTPAEARLCVRCHAPDAAGNGTSQAALWRGTGAVSVSTGQPIPRGGAHLGIAKGCIGCHSAGPTVERGAGHAFRVDRAGCLTGCHADHQLEERSSAGATIRERARTLWRRLGGQHAGRPHVELAAGLPPEDHDETRRRALSNLRLLLDDPAAAYHDAIYARRILDDVERSLP
jgi:hypothetical protein